MRSLLAGASPTSRGRDKLGLALAGGGFRASLFHLGVLHRMAQIDMLRYVEVLSTVSGGSIIGALYVLLLKRTLEQKPHAFDSGLDQQDYLDIVGELHNVLLSAITKNLRLRLFLAPWRILPTIVWRTTMGQQMGSLYQKHIFSPVFRSENNTTSSKKPLHLRELRPMRNGKNATPNGQEEFNLKALQRKGGSAITELVLNATCLNSGGRFAFSSAECGDWYLGYARASEVEELLKLKHCLESNEPVDPATLDLEGHHAVRDPALIEWWKLYRQQQRKEPFSQPDTKNFPEHWESLFAIDDFPGRLLSVALGQLRRLKNQAWFVQVGDSKDPKITGGLQTIQHKEIFWSLLQDIDPDLYAQRSNFCTSDAIESLLFDFILLLYKLRSADILAGSIATDLKKLTVAQAVGASACFPPVFTPYVFPGFYDSKYIELLALTDGGAYDNTGLTALTDAGCNHVIISDTGGKFDPVSRAPTGRIGMMTRIASALSKDINGLQRQTIKLRRKIGQLERCEPTDAQSNDTGRDIVELQSMEGIDKAAYFQIDAEPIQSSIPKVSETKSKHWEFSPSRRHKIARLRTDLDGFGEVEVDALINCGYETAAHYLSSRFANTKYATTAAAPGHWDTPLDWPADSFPSGEKAQKLVDRILDVGRLRFFRAFCLGSVVSIGVTVLALLFIAALLIIYPVSIDEVLGWISNAARRWADFLIGWFGSSTGARYSLLVLLGFVGAVVAYKKWSGRLGDYLLTKNKEQLARFVGSTRKLLSALSGNASWLVALLPLVITIGASTYAVISSVFFYQPFLRKTRRNRLQRYADNSD